MDKSTYKRYLHTQQWQKLRFEVLKRAGGKCERCGYTPWKRGVLQVHHLNYDNVGHETADDLICVCARCHMELHGIKYLYHRRSASRKMAYPSRKANEARCFFRFQMVP